MNDSKDEKPLCEEEDELDLLEYFDIEMNPKEWAARFGHLIMCGDPRGESYRNKYLEDWIHEMMGYLVPGKIDEIRKELLTQDEIDEIKNDDEAAI